MNAKDVIRQTLGHSDMILKSYINDLEDADLRLSPIDGLNCIAWQLGHLVSSERGMVEGIKPGSCPPLPPGFDENHGKNKGQADSSSNFLAEERIHRLDRRAARGDEGRARGPERVRSRCSRAGTDAKDLSDGRLRDAPDGKSCPDALGPVRRRTSQAEQTGRDLTKA